MSSVAIADEAEIAEVSKPKGPIGMGSVVAGQPKPNKFWWQDQLDLSALGEHDVKSNPNLMYFKLDLYAIARD